MHIRWFSVLPTLVVEDGNGVPKGETLNREIEIDEVRLPSFLLVRPSTKSLLLVAARRFVSTPLVTVRDGVM